MQKLRLSALFFLSLATCVLFLGACRSHPIDRRMRMSITGTWQGVQNGTLLTVYSDCRIEVTNVKGQPAGTVIVGKIDRGFDQLLITYTSPRAVCEDANGIYKFKATKDNQKMKLTMIHDDCAVRVAQLDKDWILKNPMPTTTVPPAKAAK
jgi:hypothetical protein